MQKLKRSIETKSKDLYRLYPENSVFSDERVCTFLQEIFNHITDSHTSWKLYNKGILEHVVLGKIKSDMIPKSHMYSYIDSTVRTHIETNSRYLSTFSLKMSMREYTIYIVLEKRKSKLELSQIVKYIYSWLFVLQKYADIHNAGSTISEKCSSTVHIYLYLTSLKKMSPDSTDTILNCNHVNSAFTTGCQKTTNIHVFREEEWFKVLIHESFHNSGLDFIDIDKTVNNEAIAFIKNIFPVQIADLRLYETYCEMWGEILNNMFMIVYQSRDKKRVTKKNSGCKTPKKVHNENKHMIKTLEKMLQQEAVFSCMQANKVLKHNNNMKYEDLFTVNNYKEETQCFSYYILKAIYMTHYVQFLQFCVKQTPISLDFQLNRDNLMKYVEIIEIYYKHPKTLEFMQRMREFLETENDHFIKTTMRMTLPGKF
jgi:hypothetical protein